MDYIESITAECQDGIPRPPGVAFAHRCGAGQIEQISDGASADRSVESPAMVGPVTVVPAAVMVS